MKRLLTYSPLILTLAAVLALLAYGPVPQLPHYHDFADDRSWLGLPHAADVLSNAGFALVGGWGLLRLWPLRRHPALVAGWAGYAMFLFSLWLTAFGSGYYHWVPDNARLVWDRLPIALACAGLLVAVRAECRPDIDVRLWLPLLSAFAVASVAWWYRTELLGHGDLRPYLLLQGLPLVLIPLWQTLHGAPREDRVAFGMALALYALAKLAELYDHQIMAVLGVLSGHTLKHLLATAGAGVVTARLVRRVSAPAGASLEARKMDFGYRSHN